MDCKESSVAIDPGPMGWRRIILPFRWIVYRLLRPLLLQQAEKCFELETLSAEIDKRQENSEQELARVRDELEGVKRRLAEAQSDARNELTVLQQRVRQALALAWDHVALVRRLAALEDHFNRICCSLPDSFDVVQDCDRRGADVDSADLSVPASKTCG